MNVFDFISVSPQSWPVPVMKLAGIVSAIIPDDRREFVFTMMYL
jgi:hypothetical protein